MLDRTQNLQRTPLSVLMKRLRFDLLFCAGRAAIFPPSSVFEKRSDQLRFAISEEDFVPCVNSVLVR